ncbi:hypothetical protein A1O3_08420 [Capronia epimyces CBS 606.96]|uniref:Uncharacterized protein n=1 Tax=Capronia epimyces CBS 606.96 TaxID=1182542 RepID=W9XNN2_9EURO|nr:uncharacterized protein A1O3_08420 [Capronia epimyces CBS 606.96]EXJ78920.1 hypothetical protein A1O3_08420 [Capronia epimyces CBS 606.96]
MAHSPVPPLGGQTRLQPKRTFEAYEADFGVQLEPAASESAGSRKLTRPGRAEAPALSRPPSPSSGNSLYDPRASILLVGFSGAGKRTLGIIAAAALRRQYVSFSSFFESHMGQTPYEYMSVHGLPGFRQAEIQITERLLNTCKENHVIGGLTGLGSTAQREVLRSFAKTNPVIYIQRDKVDIEGMFGDKGNLDQLYKAGDTFYRSSSNLDFFNITQTVNTADNASPVGTLKLKQTETDFIRFIHRIYGRPPKLLHSVDPFSPSYTYALQIRLEWLAAGSLEYDKLECGADMISLVIDPKLDRIGHLQDQIPKQMALLRRYTRTPIMIDVLHAQPQDAVNYIRLLRLCLRSAPEFLTVALSLDSGHLQVVASAKGFTQMVGVIHQDTPWTGSPAKFQWSALHDLAKELSCCAVRLTNPAVSTSENLPYLHDAGTAREVWTLPLIAYKTGAHGRTSICFNPVLSPVVLPSLQPQGITVTQAQSALYSSFILSKKKFTIFGRSVAYSLSPAMHNAAYAACGMPHSFSLLQSDEFSSIHSLLEDEECGGITVSLPFKRKVLPMLASISSEARDIGAVNTVVVQRERAEDGSPQIKLKGYNTDHIGIRKCIERSISPANSIRDGSTALIIGAGGMARAAIYACRMLGLTNICIYNRTLEHAQELADYYSRQNMHIHVLRTTQEPWPGQLRQPTVLVSCIPAHSIGGQSAHDLTIPEHWLQSRTGGVFIELAYKPIVTRLIRQLQLMSKSGWITVDGLDVLIEQGIAQFEIFTGRPAPVHVIRRAVRKQYDAVVGA